MPWAHPIGIQECPAVAAPCVFSRHSDSQHPLRPAGTATQRSHDLTCATGHLFPILCGKGIRLQIIFDNVFDKELGIRGELLIGLARAISSILTSLKPVLSMPTNILMTTTGLHFCFNCTRNIHKQAHCILPIKTDSLVAWILRCECDPRRPTNAMPKPFLCRERAFCCSMLSVSQKDDIILLLISNLHSFLHTILYI